MTQEIIPSRAYPMLIISHSAEQEALRVYSTVHDTFLKDHGYQVALPDNVSLDTAQKLSKAEIHASTHAEYAQHTAAYDEKGADLLRVGEKYLPQLISGLTELSLPVQDSYHITLTRYGTGGSYWPPNLITINIRWNYGIGLGRTLLHEVVHLAVEHLVEKYHIGHWQKERVVDVLSLRLLPKVAKEGVIPQDVSIVDTLFAEKYPDIDAIAAALATHTSETYPHQPFTERQ